MTDIDEIKHLEGHLWALKEDQEISGDLFNLFEDRLNAIQIKLKKIEIKMNDIENMFKAWLEG